MTPEQVKKDANDFLEGYCERCLRENRPFVLSPETIRHFGFTDEDIRTLTPCSTTSTKRRNHNPREYDKLAGLDFIRNNEIV